MYIRTKLPKNVVTVKINKVLYGHDRRIFINFPWTRYDRTRKYLAVYVYLNVNSTQSTKEWILFQYHRNRARKWEEKVSERKVNENEKIAEIKSKVREKLPVLYYFSTSAKSNRTKSRPAYSEYVVDVDAKRKDYEHWKR